MANLEHDINLRDYIFSDLCDLSDEEFKDEIKKGNIYIDGDDMLVKKTDREGWTKMLGDITKQRYFVLKRDADIEGLL